MNQAVASFVLLSLAIWPLLLVAAAAFRATRPLALRCAPWAALPALATAAALTDTGLRLPGVLLGSALVLDGTGRAFLLLNAILFLAAGLLARPLLRPGGASRFAVLLLLAMAGGFGLALAADALSFFAAATLAGYALYGLLVPKVPKADGSAWTADRVLLVSLVASDLLLFELLAMLAAAAGGVEFASLRLAWAGNGDRGLMLGLLIASLGIKTGVVGVHFWLAPAFVSALSAVRPALIGVMLGAGLLGWLRLLPLGDVHWSGAGTLLQWLAWITLGYAVFAGLLQTQARSVLAYAAMALTGLWLAMLGSALLYPQTWNGMAEALHIAVLQSGFALTALLLLNRHTVGNVPAWLRHLSQAVVWLAALLLAATPVGVAGALAKVDGTAATQLSWATAAIAFLVARSLLLIAPTIKGARDMSSSLYVVQQPTAMTLLAAGGVTAAALLAAAYNLVGLSPAELWRPALMVSAAALAALLSVNRLVPRLPALPPGDLLVPISNGLATALGHGRRLADTRLPLWRNAGLDLLRRPWSSLDWKQFSGRLESGLNHWPTALVILALLGLIVAGLGASE